MLLVEVPPGVVTLTSTVAEVSAGEIAVICVFETDVTVPAVVPKSTAVSPVKPDPLTVTDVPPATGPAPGPTPVTAGTGS